jgi:hypothetical protein
MTGSELIAYSIRYSFRDVATGKSLTSCIAILLEVPFVPCLRELNSHALQAHHLQVTPAADACTRGCSGGCHQGRDRLPDQLLQTGGMCCCHEDSALQGKHTRVGVMQMCRCPACGMRCHVTSCMSLCRFPENITIGPHMQSTTCGYDSACAQTRRMPSRTPQAHRALSSCDCKGMYGCIPPSGGDRHRQRPVKHNGICQHHLDTGHNLHQVAPGTKLGGVYFLGNAAVQGIQQWCCVGADGVSCGATTAQKRLQKGQRRSMMRFSYSGPDASRQWLAYPYSQG